MPELPEVEFARRQLQERAEGQVIATVAVLHASQRRHLPAPAQRALVGRRIVEVRRRAKVQLLHLDDGAVLEVHFRMTGDWAFTAQGDAVPSYARVQLTLASGVTVHLVDSRALSVVRRHAPGTFTDIDAGPEPLNDAFTADVLRAALASRRGPIKAVLLDQRVIAGVGNIYAAEALWEARIAPQTPAHVLSPARVARLRDAIVHVLRTAPASRYYERAASTPRDDGTGLTLSGTTDAEPWRVYDRAGEPCLRCGSRLQYAALAGRGTYWCGRCQRR